MVELVDVIKENLGDDGPGYLSVDNFLGHESNVAMRRECVQLRGNDRFERSYSGIDSSAGHGMVKHYKDGVYSAELDQQVRTVWPSRGA